MSTEKTCKVCGETKEAIQGVWVMKHGKPEGQTCLACHNARSKKDKARLVIDPVSGKEMTARKKSKSRLVPSQRTGELITANSAYTDKHLSQSPWHKLKAKIRKETRRLLKQLAQGKGTNKACLKLFGADRETCLKQFNKQLAARNWTWQDYLAGGIEIDHRVPLSAAMSDADLRTLALLPNVQLLTKDENAIKAIADKAHSA